MIQCADCEYFRRGENGEIAFACDPFSTIKEPECLAKLQLVKMNQMVSCYQATLSYYDKFAPMQEKMFRMMESEIDDISEADRWKYDEDDDPEDADQNDEFDTGEEGENEDWRNSL